MGDHKHLTFFEMLGNFSIGDYFKQDAVAFAWDLCTGLFGLEPERMYVTVHLDDDEAYDLWLNDIGVPPERIYRYGNSDNWWGPAGLEGPTGPCSELHYDGGAEKGRGQHPVTDEMMAPDELTAMLRREADEGIPAEPGGCPSQLRLRAVCGVVEPGLYAVLPGPRGRTHPAAGPQRGHRHGPRARCRRAARQAQRL